MAELNIVLHEPEIPANTGNIGRTCVATGTKLHLIEPLGFSLSEKHLKRAGMDYWKDLDVTVYENWEDFCKRNPGAKIYYATTKGRHVYSDVHYEPDCFIMFGKESAGIPEEILKANPDTCVRIPMIGIRTQVSGYLCAYSDDRGNPFFELIEFCCHCAL